MNVHEMSYSMTSSMSVVQLIFPQMFPRKNIKISSGDVLSLRPAYSLKLEITKKNASVRVFFFGGWISSKMEGSRDIRSPVKVLTSTVAEVDEVRLQQRSSLLLWLIVDDSSIRPNTADGVKARSLGIFELSTLFIENAGH